MKPVLVLPILLIVFNPLAADEPPSSPPPESSTRDLDSTQIQNLRRAIQRLPAAAVRSRTAAGTTVTSEQATARAAPVDLSGNWLLTLPAGYQYRVSFDALGDDRYRLRNAVCFSGEYQLNGEVLQLVEPSDERLDVFDWQLHNVNSMTLVNETGATGARYAGATMGRQIDRDDQELPRQITVIGRPAVPQLRSTTRTPSTVSRRMTYSGTAFHDEAMGPYLETEATIVFMAGIEAWPEAVLGRTVRVTGNVSRFVIQDQGESLPAQRMQIDSWSRVDDAEVNANP